MYFRPGRVYNWMHSQMVGYPDWVKVEKKFWNFLMSPRGLYEYDSQHWECWEEDKGWVRVEPHVLWTILHSWGNGKTLLSKGPREGWGVVGRIGIHQPCLLHCVWAQVWWKVHQGKLNPFKELHREETDQEIKSVELQTQLIKPSLAYI